MVFRKHFHKSVPEGKYRRFVHSPTKVTEKKHEIEITEEGRVIITENQSDDEYDEVNVPASLIYKIVNLLESTRTTKLVDKEAKNG